MASMTNSHPNLLRRQWFLFALAGVLSIGFLFSKPLQTLSEFAWLKASVVATVLFLMALPLEFSSMWAALRRPAPTLLAIAINFGLLPAFAWLVSLTLTETLAVGLLVTAATPCTLASAAVWTRRAGGNDAVALMVTIFTNLTCFLVTPALLLITTGRGGVDIPAGEMVARLGFLVVLPIVLGQLSRLRRPIGLWATRRKTTLSTLAQCGILFMVMIGAIRSGIELRETTDGKSLAATDFASMLGAVVVVHSAALAAGHVLATVLGIDRPNRIAVGFAGSQKTLMVGLYVATTYFGGLAILPMVAYHVVQLLIDTVVADQSGFRPSVDSGADRGSASSNLPF
jgi:sodium/bile acid cotransporter 7